MEINGEGDGKHGIMIDRAEYMRIYQKWEAP